MKTVQSYPRAHGRAKATNVTLNATMLAEARELGINVSKACEKGLAQQISDEKMRRWNEENKASIEAWNEWVEQNGLPLARYRQF